MPVINGKPSRAIFQSLKLGELSSVDRPAQKGAKAVILKRDSAMPEGEALKAVIDTIAKYVCEDDGATSFEEVLAENKFSQDIWPFTDALSQSIRSIVGDRGLGAAEREAAITQSVSEFLTAVRGISPTVEKQLRELIKQGEDDMPKTVEELAAECEKLQGTITELTARAEKAESALATVTAERDTAKAAATEKGDTVAKLAEVTAQLETAKADLAKATDETVTVGGETFAKSEMGESSFRAMKAMAAERDMAKFEKAASDDYPHLAGTTAEKALVLKARAGMPEEAQKALDAILSQTEKMAKAGFDRLGSQDYGTEPTKKAAQSDFESKVADIKKRDNCTEAQAMSKARKEFPSEFAAAFGN